MMSHLLDNPVWAALTSGNQSLSMGNEIAKFFPAEVSPFAAIKEFNPQNFQELYDVVPYEKSIAIFTNENTIYPHPWKIIDRIDGFQMVYQKQAGTVSDDIEIVKLDQRHVPEMLLLTSMTGPGPFLQETIRFENYEGIIHDDKLVAMAGQRFHSGDYKEISAVCTHPDYLGRGYAKQLINSQICSIQAGGKIPYLHVKGVNKRAIDIYQFMGFEIRSEMVIYILSKC